MVRAIIDKGIVGAFMQWEYKLVALGLIVDATVPHQRKKHEQILNDLGREEWEAFAYSARSDTVLLKRRITNPGESGEATHSTAQTS